MRQILITVPLLFYLVCSFAQANPNKGKITGNVFDSLTKAPVDFATVTLFKGDVLTPFNGMSTDKNGSFTLTGLPAGEYRLSVDFLGYQPKWIEHLTIGTTATTLPLGKIFLSRKLNQLKDVTITAKGPIVENKIDKIVYNVDNDLTAQGGVALDVLKKVPMVSVDIDGNVELQGNANIRFLINGKPSSIFGASLADALQSIPASQIKSIEVITSPGAKYDASGTGGIINIVLKSTKLQGINGSVNLSAGTRLENGSFNLNVRKGNIGAGLFFSGNKQLNSTVQNTTDRLSYTDLQRDSVSRLYQQGSNPFTRGGYQTGINFNWSITPRDQLTASFAFNHFGNHGTGTTGQEQQAYLSSTGNVFFDLMSTRNSTSQFNANATDWSLGYKKTFKKEKQELDVLVNSSNGRNTSNASQLTDYLNIAYPSAGMQSNNPGTDHETDISVDYAHPVSEGFTIETGVKAVLEKLTSNVTTDTLLSDGSYVNNAAQTYNYAYQRNVYAAYLTTSYTLFHDFLTGNAGLRYEFTNTTAGSTGAAIPDYNTFAPSFLAQHKLSESQYVKFAYDYRIQRPDYGDLNPFVNISDPHNMSSGNPLLKPEIGHHFELGYNKTFKKGSLYFAGFYRYNTNDIQPLTTFYPVLTVYGTDYLNVSLTKRDNLGRETDIGASIFGSLSLISKLNLRTNIQIGDRTNTTPGYTSRSGLIFRINLNASYQFANDFMAEVFGNYRSSFNNIQGTRPAFFFYNLAVRKQFLNKKLSIGITAANQFNYYISQKTTTFGPNFNQTNIRMVPFQSFGISVNYRFGKLELKKNPKEENEIPALPAEN
jgi:ferric enterobactin receptor